MRVIEPGHIYEIQNADGPGTQRVVFVKRRGADARLLIPEQQHEGVLSQELLRVLIDRTRYLNDEDPCVEDVEIIRMLRGCLRLFESRAARRTIEKLPMPETADVCPVCHHLLCDHRAAGRLAHEVRR